jgi:hypothetical protein
MKRKPYLYQAVSGASVWGQLTTLRTARVLVCGLRLNRRDAEVERVECLPDGGRRYWRWRGVRWSHKKHYDPTTADLAKWDYAPSIQQLREHEERRTS